MKTDLDELTGFLTQMGDIPVDNETHELLQRLKDVAEELRAARALIQTIEPYQQEPGDQGDTVCVSCGEVATLGPPPYHERSWTRYNCKHKPDCALVAYDTLIGLAPQRSPQSPPSNGAK